MQTLMCVVFVFWEYVTSVCGCQGDFFQNEIFICLLKKDDICYLFAIYPGWPCLSFSNLPPVSSLPLYVSELVFVLGHEVVLIASTTRFPWPRSFVHGYCVEISSCYHDNKLLLLKINTAAPGPSHFCRLAPRLFCSSLVVLASEDRRACHLKLRSRKECFYPGREEIRIRRQVVFFPLPVGPAIAEVLLWFGWAR